MSISESNGSGVHSRITQWLSETFATVRPYANLSRSDDPSRRRRGSRDRSDDGIAANANGFGGLATQDIPHDALIAATDASAHTPSPQITDGVADLAEERSATTAADDARVSTMFAARGDSSPPLTDDVSKPVVTAQNTAEADVLGAAPMTLSTVVTGSSTPAPSQPTGLNVSPCCGSCGYVNCPLQAMAQAATTKLTGELYGSGSPGAADAVLSRSGTIGASLSDPMLSKNVAPAPDWTISPVIVSNGSLPGGGETGAGPNTKPFGILGGSVTSPQVQAQARVAAAAAAAAPNAIAALASNAIALENQKLGNPESEWGIDGAGSSNIEGFATDISVNHGNTINFKINTNSNNYRIDIYRLGYYGGMGARKVDTIQHTGVQNQPNPLRDATTGLVDAGNWAVSASWNVPADAVSGVYIAKLVRQDGTFGENHIPFIVRDDSSQSDIIFQTADLTWQAYNGWGGANFYGGNGPATGQGSGRAYALSYNRPIATRGNVGTFAGPQDYLFGAEYAAISWLEQNGYDVSYMAGVDADRFGSLLLNHQVYMDVGHDEYWSGQQRANVEAARDAGVNLQFWSGNEVYWRTRWGNAISSDATPYRTMISYKETWSPDASIDPSNQWTGTFRDPRLSPPAIGGGNPENSLTGQLFKVDDVLGNLQAIRVPYDDANLRFWRNTSIANLQPGQTATLTRNYLGYEWDEAVDNGFDPAGLVRLSTTTLPVSTYLLDYGNTTGNGTSTHNLSLYRAPSGALVFGAGTVYWSWGVSDNHDNEATPTDPRVQQAMVNLFADMGVQPATLQSGLITGLPSTDTTAPTSTINAPPASVSAGTTVTISGTATDAGGGVIAGVEVTTDNGASWHPATGDETWTYTFTPQVAGNYTIRSRAVDDSINLETPSAVRTLTVSGATFTSLFPGSATPAILNTNDDGAVELGVRFQSSVAGTISGIRFYKSNQDTGVHTGKLWSSTGAILGNLTFSNETDSGWQSATFSTPITVTPGVTYTASYHSNVGHYSSTGNYFTSSVTSGPLTAPASGNGVFAYGNNSIFPTQTFQATNFWVDVMFNPATGTSNVAPVATDDPGPAVVLNTPVTISAASLLANDSDANGDQLTITAVNTNAASHGTVALNTQTNTITFTPEAGYLGAAGFSYTVSDGRGGTDTADVSLNVTATPPPVVASFFSAANIPAETNLNDGLALEVGMKFTSSTAGQITALKFYRNAGDTGPDLLSLWTSTGTKLGSATFTSTGASGWQTVTLPTPVNINANTTYVASYHTTGAYVATNNYFTSAITSGPLTAPSTTTSGGNGVYTYGGNNTAGIFPTSTFGAANYWVDVVFTSSTGGGGNNTTPTAVADTGDATERGGTANGSGGSSATGNVLANDTDPDTGDTKAVSAVSFGATTGTLGSALAGAFGSLVLSAAGAFTYTVNETAAAVQALRLSTNTLTDVFTYTMRDTANATSTATLTVTIHGANDAPVLAAQTANQNAVVGSAFSLVLTANTFTDVDTGDTLTYTATLTDGSALPAWLAFNATTRTFSGTPAAANVGTLSVRVTATDLGSLAASETFSIGVTTTTTPPPPPPPTGVSFFTASNTPAQTSLNDGRALEVGMKFTSSTAGQITALKFYRSAGDTGPDLLSLWTSTGTKLASATFSSTTGSGWQTVTLPTPVNINANTTYVASYHTTGAYVATNNYFTSAITSGPLTAPSTSTSGGNGVYTYGGTNTAGIFPTNTFGAANYWVDVVFNGSTGGGSNTAPTAVADTGDATERGGTANGSGGSAATGNVLTNDTDPDTGDTKTVSAVSFGATTGTLGAALNGARGSLVLNASGAFTYTVNENDSAVQALRLSTNTLTDVFSYTMRDTAGVTSTANLTITIHGANDAPVLAAQTANQNAVVGSAFSLVLPASTFTDADTGDTLTYSATLSDGSALPSWLTFNQTTRTLSGTPAAANVGTLNIRATATDLGSLAASETFSIAVTTTTTPPPPSTVSLFSASNTPTQTNLNDGRALEVGMKFTSSTAGQITALKFYRSAGDTGSDLLSLWTSTGTKLASATFTNTTATGWQTVTLPTPVNINANTTYVASYHTNGAYVATGNFFTTALTSGPLTAPSTSTSGGNGVYAYGGNGTNGLFPTSTFGASNYYADVVFRPQLAA